MSFNSELIFKADAVFFQKMIRFDTKKDRLKNKG